MNPQAMRVRVREVGNLVFTSSVDATSAAALKGVVQLLTGTTIDPGTKVVIIGLQHELRLECEEPFLLCPADAKTRESSLHEMNTVLQKDFEKALQNLNRFVLKKDGNGRPTNSLSEHARVAWESDGPLFNEWTGYVFFHITAKGQRMEKLVQEISQHSSKHSLQKLFDMRIPGGEYLMGPSLMALQDYYMATMFWAKMNILSSKRSFYTMRLAQYKRLDGMDGRRNMRTELQLTLESYLDKYPEVLQSVRKARSRSSAAGIEACGAPVDPAALDEIDNWATGPAGGRSSPAGPNNDGAAGTLSSHLNNFVLVPRPFLSDLHLRRRHLRRRRRGIRHALLSPRQLSF